jgi:hypothetical protein
LTSVSSFEIVSSSRSNCQLLLYYIRNKLPESYIVFWKKDKIDRILKNGDDGPLSVLYGGPHQSQPAFGKLRAGDVVFPFTMVDGVMYLIGRMVIEEIVNADEYLANALKIQPCGIMWDDYWNKHKSEVGHKIPTTCADDAAIGSGSALQKRAVPAEVAARIRVGPKPGAESPLKMKDGKLLTTGLIGYYRRLSEESAALLNDLIEG